MSLKRIASAATAATLALTLSVNGPAAHADSTESGSFKVVTQARLLDTRTGLGVPRHTLGPGTTLTFVAAPGIAGPVSAVAVTVTAVSPAAAGYLTVFAAGTTRPPTSDLPFAARQTTSNLVVTRVGGGNKVSIYNGSTGSVDVLADAHGYFTGGPGAHAAGTFVPISPARFLDTRIGNGSAKGAVGPFSVTKVKIAGLHGLPADATAVAVNVIAVSNTAHGYITAYPGEPNPGTSTVDYAAHQSRASLALLQIGTDGTISLLNGAGAPVNLIADVTGYFAPGDPTTDGSFLPNNPSRIFDSRAAGGVAAAPATTSRICVLTLDPTDPSCPTDPALFSIFKAVVVNVTAVNPQKVGYLTAWDGVGGVPAVSGVQFSPGSSFAGSVVLAVNADGTISVRNGSAGKVDLIVDITGYVLNSPPATPGEQAAGKFTSRLKTALLRVKQLSKSPKSVAVSVTR